jgi:tetratricopeptide (TPR) repeat protein
VRANLPTPLDDVRANLPQPLARVALRPAQPGAPPQPPAHVPIDLDASDPVAPMAPAPAAGAAPALPFLLDDELETVPAQAPAPGASAIDLELENLQPAPDSGAPTAGNNRPTPATPKRLGEKAPSPAKRKTPRWQVALMALVILGVGGVLVGRLTPYGMFGIALLTGKPSAESSSGSGGADPRANLDLDTKAGYDAALAQIGSSDPITKAQAELSELVSVGGASSLLTDAQSAINNADPKTPAQVLADTKGLAQIASGDVDGAVQTLTGAMGNGNDAAPHVFLGWALYATGDYAGARQAFQAGASADGKDAAALFGEGLAAWTLGDLKGAGPLFASTLTASPNHFGAKVAQTLLAARQAGQDGAAAKDLLTAANAGGPVEVARGWVLAADVDRAVGELDAAVSAYQQGLQAQPGFVDAVVGLAEVQCQLGEFSDAKTHLQPLAAGKNHSVPMLVALARAETGLGDAAGALATLAPLANKAPTDPRVATALAQAVVGGGAADALDRARAHFAEAHKAAPTYAPAYVSEAETLAGAGQAADALAAVQNGLHAIPGDPSLSLELAKLELASNAPTATADLASAVALAPHDPQALLLSAQAALAAKDYTTAQTSLESLKGAAQTYPGLAEALATTYTAEGRASDALAVLTDALGRTSSPSITLRDQAASAYVAVGGQDDKALTLAQSVLSDDPLDAGAHFVVGSVELHGKQLTDAISDLKQAAARDPSHPEYLLTLASALETDGHYDEALDPLEQALKLNADLPTHVAHAQCLEALGQYDAAILELTPLQTDPKVTPTVFSLLGAAYVAKGDRANTITAYEKAVKLDPDDPTAYYYLGQAYADEDEAPKAIGAFQSAVGKGGDTWALAADTYYRLGVEAVSAGDKKTAADAFHKYLSLAPPSDVNRVSAQQQLDALGG